MSETKLKAYLGTSGFSYAEWKGIFYPAKLPNKEMLSFYAQKLPSVEINNTFYRMPRRSMLEGWANQTPESFRFTIKAPRRITHFKKLTDTAELLGYLFGAVSALGVRRGPVLFQLPPTMRADVPLLSEFLATVRSAASEHFGDSAAVLPAFEFRHASWFVDSVFDTLREGGAALVSGDLDDSEKDPPLVKTAQFAYLRLRKTNYEPAELEGWAERIEGLGVEAVYAYFKHEVLGPQLAADLSRLVS